jgi:BASS family bile acid:Na+ symporter
MEANSLTSVLLPLALFIIMMGMGLTLTVKDFLRVVETPKAAVIGLAAQLLLLPLVGFAIAALAPLSPELAVGLVLISACPGGPTSNLITFLGKGDVALSISLTAVSSLVTVFTIPRVVNLAMATFLGETAPLDLPFWGTVAQIAAVTLVPVTLGMVLRATLPRFARWASGGIKWLSLGFLALIIAGVLLRERANVISFFAQVGSVTLLLNLATMALGFAIATLARLSQPRTTAITLEVGIQNGTLAITLATTLLNNSTMAIPAAIYSLLMFATGGLFAAWAGRGAIATPKP